MALQPIDYSSAGLQALQGGLQSGLGLREAGMRQQLFDQQMEQQKRQDEFSASLKSAWDSGDNKSMADLLASNPEQLQVIQGLIGFRDEQHKKEVGNVANLLANSLESGNVNGAASIIASNADLLSSLGQDPVSLMKQLQEDPQTLQREANTYRLMTMSPSEILDYRQKLEDQELRRQQIAATVRGQDMSASTAAADRAQRAQAQAENIRVKLAELGAKPSLDVKDIKGINSDITSLKKDSDVMYSAASDLQTIRDNATPAAQLAAIFKFMKALDPTSVVREGEQVMLQKTGGVFDTMGNYVNQLNSGSRLNAKQLQDLTNTAKRLSNSAAGSVNTSLDDYLATYGDTLSEGQKRLFQNRKLKMFDVPKAAESEVSETSRPKDSPPIPKSNFSSLWGG